MQVVDNEHDRGELGCSRKPQELIDASLGVSQIQLVPSYSQREHFDFVQGLQVVGRLSVHLEHPEVLSLRNINIVWAHKSNKSIMFEMKDQLFSS